MLHCTIFENVDLFKAFVVHTYMKITQICFVYDIDRMHSFFCARLRRQKIGL